MASLIIRLGNDTPQEHPLEGEITTIGRTTENTIVLDHGSVSSRHAEIRCADGRYSVHDLRSSNGTTLNGSPIENSALNDGDLVCFGGVEATFLARAAEASQQSAPTPTETSSTKREAAPSSSFASKIKGLAGALWSETRRAGKLTALKAKLSKLKNVDLNTAHYALGKKCYELGLHKEKLETEFAAIAELEKQIVEKKAGHAAVGDETNTQKAKRTFGNVAGKAGAKMVEMTLKQKLVGVGEAVATSLGSNTALPEMERVTEVQKQIEDNENQQLVLGTDSSGKRVHAGRYWIVVGVVLVLLVVVFNKMTATSQKTIAGSSVSDPQQKQTSAKASTALASTRKQQGLGVSIASLEMVSLCQFSKAPPLFPIWAKDAAHGTDALKAANSKQRLLMITNGPVDNITSLKVHVIISEDKEEEDASKMAAKQFSWVITTACSGEAGEWVISKLRAAISESNDPEPPTRVFGKITVDARSKRGIGTAYDSSDERISVKSSVLVFSVTVTMTP